MIIKISLNLFINIIKLINSYILKYLNFVFLKKILKIYNFIFCKTPSKFTKNSLYKNCKNNSVYIILKFCQVFKFSSLVNNDFLILEKFLLTLFFVDLLLFLNLGEPG